MNCELAGTPAVRGAGEDAGGTGADGDVGGTGLF